MRPFVVLLAFLAILTLVLPVPGSAGPEQPEVPEGKFLAATVSAEEEPAPAATPDQEAQDELKKIREAARSQTTATEEDRSKDAGEGAFVSGALSLQALNPEISVTGDYLTSYRGGGHVDANFENSFRTLALHLESYLDPYSKFKAALEFSPEGTELGEAYFTRFAVLGNMSLTLGKFRQQFGVVNRWHKHALDQVDFPLPLRQIFGPDGLNQIGASVDWQMPSLAGAVQEITVQLTNGQNPNLFGENTDGVPSLLAHYKNYRDLSENTYLELGATGLAGRNDTWELPGPSDETVAANDHLWTTVLGLDLTILWEPTDNMRYRNWVWRSEVYLANKDILAPDGSGESTIRSWGATTYYQTKVSRTWELGTRLDYYEPDVKPYAGASDSDLWPLATVVPDAHQWLAAAYATWSESPWVHWRLEYDHQWNGDLGPDDDTVWFQCVFAAGPHKHDRY